MEVFVLLLLIVTWDVPDYQDRCFTTSPKEDGQEVDLQTGGGRS